MSVLFWYALRQRWLPLPLMFPHACWLHEDIRDNIDVRPMCKQTGAENYGYCSGCCLQKSYLNSSTIRVFVLIKTPVTPASGLIQDSVAMQPTVLAADPDQMVSQCHLSLRAFYFLCRITKLCPTSLTANFVCSMIVYSFQTWPFVTGRKFPNCSEFD